MRLLVFAVCLAALGAASFWALTSGPLAPGVEAAAAFQPVEATVPEWSAESTAAGGPATFAPPARIVRTRIGADSYAVSGDTEREVLDALLAAGPRDGDDIFFGLTQTELDVNYQPTEIAGGCVIKETEVDLDVVVTLPAWTPGADAAPGLARDWGRFLRALRAHEEEHREIAVDGAQRAYDAVAELYRPTCAEAEVEARRRLETIGVEVVAEHRRFDQETGHGRSDGATWPVRD